MENIKLQKQLAGKTIESVEYPDHESNYVVLFFTDKSFVKFCPKIYKGELIYLNNQFYENYNQKR